MGWVLEPELWSSGPAAGHRIQSQLYIEVGMGCIVWRETY